MHINAGKNATVNNGNDTVKQLGATVNNKSATVNDTVNGENDTVNKQNATVKVGGATVKISDTQIAILELLSGNGKLTAEDIASDIGKDVTTIKRAVKKLKENGLLARVGSDKTGYWKVKGRL